MAVYTRVLLREMNQMDANETTKSNRLDKSHASPRGTGRVWTHGNGTTREEQSEFFFEFVGSLAGLD